MTKPQNAGVGGVEVMRIDCQQHSQGLRVNQKRFPHSHLPTDPSRRLWMHLLSSVSEHTYACFLILSNCSSEKPEQISHGFSRVTQGSSPLLASLQAGQ